MADRAFPVPWTLVPDLVFDGLPDWSPVELKVILYLCRARFGFMRQSVVTLDELQFGQRDADGNRLDRGVGAHADLNAALESLRRRNLIAFAGHDRFRLNVVDDPELRPRAEATRRAAPVRKTGGQLARLRFIVFQRDHGICARCRFDAGAEENLLRELREATATAELESRLVSLRARGFVIAVGAYPRSLWDMDHVVPLAQGGGDELSNLRTLCTPCHKLETTTAARERATKRGSS